MKLGTMRVLELLLSIFTFVGKIHFITGCLPRHYYSENLGGCTPCHLAACSDQDPRDVTRCKEACERKTTTAGDTKTKVPPKNDRMKQLISTGNPPQPDPTAKKPLDTSAGDESSTNSERLAICIAVLATFVVLLIVAVVYCWRRSSTSILNEKSSKEERIEICIEPHETPCSSNEPSPAVWRSRSEQSKDNGEIVCVLVSPQTEKRASVMREMESRLNLDEEEN